MSPLHITASYLFMPLSQDGLSALQQELKTFGHDQGMQGLVLIAPEGINSTVAGSADAIRQWKDFLTAKFGPIIFKDSRAEKNVFSRFSVKIKPEIVGIKNPALRPSGHRKHLTPEEFHKIMSHGDAVILDARNAYEVAIGKFRDAVDPGTSAFHEFPAWAKTTGIPKEKKVMMYCTGGIRCEKALMAMEQEGFENVYQLEGGILAYLEKYPHGAFEGECFIFDHRVAVDSHLQPTKIYDICPHCGDPGKRLITCVCGGQQKICEKCSMKEAGETCSKRCRNEVRKRATMKSCA